MIGLSAAAAAAAAGSQPALAFLRAAPTVPDPLLAYPTRGWERVYRDQYAYDSSFTFVCAPNDTHMCRLRAFVRNGIVMRTEQSYDVSGYRDTAGRSASVAWHPRGCPKGYTVQRRIYGPYRLKYPVVRSGWKAWADAGFPSLSDRPELRTTYKFNGRGDDDFVRLSWDEVNDYLARALRAVAETYSGDAGRRRLIERDGYPVEMLTHWEGAGVRTMKMGCSLPLHGIAGKWGPFRFANMMALLDAQVRKVSEEHAVGARGWSEYTWRGDQAPGFPFVHGLQGAEVDFNDLRNSRLLIQIGKNLVENKMPDSHFFHEVMERGGTIVNIGPEYGPQSSKSDYWIPVRPGLSDTALLLGVAKALVDRGAYDRAFLVRFTDLPLLIRLDTLRRIDAADVFRGYVPRLTPEAKSFTLHGMTAEQYARIGDRVVFDRASGAVRAVTREDVGDRLRAAGIDPELDWTGPVRLADGTTVPAATAFAMYRRHLGDYDLETVLDITGSPRDLVERLIDDIATIKPAAIHVGEGVNHYFHATLHNRAAYLVLMLTGNIGKPGAGVSTWAGNYKGGIFHAAPWFGPGVGGYVREDPFHPLLNASDRYTKSSTHEYGEDEETSYWGYGDRPLIVDTPAEGRKVFTGKTHMPSPTKVIWYNNANLINQAKWAYELIRNVNPKVDLIIDQQVEWTGSAEFADVVLPANSWLEQQTYEMGGSCSNPFLQIWKGGIAPLYDTRDDLAIFGGVARALTKLTGEARFAQYFAFADRPEVYLDRVLAGSFTTEGYTVADVVGGTYGVPGAALMQYGSYPRVPFLEQVRDSLPFYTDTGRMNAYCDLPEAIEYGENLIVHREAIEATPYLPNVIVSTSPYLRPKAYGIPVSDIDPGRRQVRNVMLPWSAVKQTANPLWTQGFRFYCLTPKSRHSVHSSWAVTDWNWLWSSNFADPHREDRRSPGVSEPQLHMNPQAAMDLGLANGDVVWIDANPADRPFVGWQQDPAFYQASRLMARVSFNPAYPYDVTMLKHAFYMATPRTVRAQRARADGRALAAGTGYQASFRSGSQQSLTRGWAPPMHQTDSLFHKKAGALAFVFGFDEDNHAVNTIPKETLVRITKAEDGGIGGNGPWRRGQPGMDPGPLGDAMKRYLAGGLVVVRGR